MYTRSKSTNEQEPETLSNETGKMAATPKPTKALTLEDVFAEIKKGNDITNGRLDKLEDKIDNNQQLIKDYIKTNDEAITKISNKVEKLENNYKGTDDTVKGLENRLTEMTNELASLQRNVDDQKKILDMLHKKDKEQDIDKKRSNIIVEGFKETDKENTRHNVIKLLTDIGVTNANENVVTAFRLGNVSKAHANPRPRPILVKLTQQSYKYEVYKHVKNIKDLADGKRVFIKDDLPPEIAQQRQELRCLAAAARDRELEATVRGGAIIVDNKRYTYAEIGDLPDGITMESAKLVAIDDGYAFQSHFAFPSNMFPCEIDHDGHKFNCSEQVYWYDMAEAAGNKRVQAKVHDSKNGYEAKREGGRMKFTDEVVQLKEPTMAKAIDKKFRQNPALKQKLMDLKGNLYEATRDELFGTGLVLAQKDKIGKPGMPGANKLGHQLMDLRGKFWDETKG